MLLIQEITSFLNNCLIFKTMLHTTQYFIKFYKDGSKGVTPILICYFNLICYL